MARRDPRTLTLGIFLGVTALAGLGLAAWNHASEIAVSIVVVCSLLIAYRVRRMARARLVYAPPTQRSDTGDRAEDSLVR